MPLGAEVLKVAYVYDMMTAMNFDEEEIRLSPNETLDLTTKLNIFPATLFRRLIVLRSVIYARDDRRLEVDIERERECVPFILLIFLTAVIDIRFDCYGIFGDKEHIALSNYQDGEASSVHSIKSIAAGLLRNGSWEESPESMIRPNCTDIA